MSESDAAESDRARTVRPARWGRVLLVYAAFMVGSHLAQSWAERADGKSLVPDATRPTAPPPEPALSITEVEAVHAALVARDYAALEQRLVWHLDSARTDFGYEHRYRTVFDAFADHDGALNDALDQWVASSPRSSVARLARATHYSATGWAARGTKSASQTSRAQFHMMHYWFDLAQADIAVARRIDSTNVLSYWLILGLGPMGDDDLRTTLDDGLRQVPGSLLLRARYAYYLRPSWSSRSSRSAAIHDVVLFADEADRDASLNERLHLIRGFVAYDSARVLSRYDSSAAAIEMYGRALRFGDYWMFRLARGREYSYTEQWQQAKVDYDAVIAELPTSTEARVRRALSCYELKRRLRPSLERATLERCLREDLRLALELDPMDADLQWTLKENPFLMRYLDGSR